MKPTAEFTTLVDKCLSQTISRVEMARLEEFLEDNEHLRYYLELVEVEGNLPYSLDAGVILQPTANTFSWRKLIRPLSIAAAAVIVFSAGFYIGSPPQDSSAEASAGGNKTRPASKAAAITSLVGVTWENAAPESIKLTNDSEALAFTSGLVEISFGSGVRSLVEGPAVIKVTGENSAILERGRMVSEVPKGAEGFTIDYPDGKVVDLGTEFAIHVPQNQHGAEVGVFRGEVEIYDREQNTPLKILENHAVVQVAGSRNPFASIPFHRDQYIRELPTSEFPWKLSEVPSREPEIMDFDVSHLVWRPSTYRAIIKYMHGSDSVIIHRAELLFNGRVISTDDHTGSSGYSLFRDNAYSFDVPQGLHEKGKWTVRITASPAPRGQLAAGDFSPDSSGILLFEDTRTSDHDDEDFIGTWEYRHNGDIHRRVFTKDKKAQYYFNGRKTHLFDAASWEVRDKILTLTIPPPNTNGTPTHVETHQLKSKDELIFVNRPYRSALRVK
ncbi:FecR domain-containing protein [Verrucomicrobiaceae bacterium N1E253]|uniref:FecR domain-containing protein n=1 Tax=Oceaniferula marina TaxID=2748318 RepID=A0A851GA77_9BACT|nr:FecR domain-containing protein [Oceaniferula marina]NWK54513.1 FecR domain-containing protein [Oceaniferula marina]